MQFEFMFLYSILKKKHLTPFNCGSHLKQIAYIASPMNKQIILIATFPAAPIAVLLQCKFMNIDFRNLCEYLHSSFLQAWHRHVTLQSTRTTSRMT